MEPLGQVQAKGIKMDIDRLVSVCRQLIAMNDECEICDETADDGGCTDIWQSACLGRVLEEIKSIVKES